MLHAAISALLRLTFLGYAEHDLIARTMLSVAKLVIDNAETPVSESSRGQKCLYAPGYHETR